MAKFLSWIKKRGFTKRLSSCELTWSHQGFLVEEEIKKIGPPWIFISRRGGEKVVILTDLVWADRWMTHYGVEIPHHGQFQRTKTKLSELEQKGNV